MLKTSLIKFIFVNIVGISCFFKFLNSLFIFSKWSACTISKSPSISTLLNGVLIPNLLNSPFSSWFLINLDFLQPDIAHFDNTITLPLLVLQISGSMFSVFFYTLNNMIPFYTLKSYFKKTHSVILIL